ncbi:FIG001592: Phosphocarrier protein kinase/phosphorylase, nitrogen regulation associated [hydrothermal vent metagenome]|uniref:phosphoenolpyruvate--protein phosphotransferase n=1 Tax=hydrothermal vent metagenome TaxID=652676 RepID=A0A3B0Z6Y8_9ZZZZ
MAPIVGSQMLGTLRRIVQEVNNAPSLEVALQRIVLRVKQAMGVDTCSIYLRDSEQMYVLMATQGLNPTAVGRVRLSPKKGLIGLVGERAEPINLDDAPSHKCYQYFPETGEEAFHGFLGVPIIQQSQVVGVLAVQEVEGGRFEEDSVSFLITVAAQLASAIAHAEVTGDTERLLGKERRSDRPLVGLAGSAGVALGCAVVVYPLADLNAVPDRLVSDTAAEVQQLMAAVDAVRNDIKLLLVRLSDMGVSEDDRVLFEVYLMMLDSGGMVDKIVEYIDQGLWAAGALKKAVLEHVSVFEAMEDPYLSERALDIRDLGIRILAHLQNVPDRANDYPASTVLVGEEITATMLAEVPPGVLSAVISVRGSNNSHVAILARAMGVPCVMGMTDFPTGRVDGQEIVVDGYQGKVYIKPSEAISREYQRLIAEEREFSAELDGLRDEPAKTKDGVVIPLYANTGLLSDIGPSLKCGAEGVGLYRTEFPFLIRDRFPGEDEQCRIYRQVFDAFKGRPVVVRSLDIGGDKALSYFPINEENPFLGWRGIRVTLDHPEIFLVQMRAIFRASEGGDNLNILLPMVTNLSEVELAKQLISRAAKELEEEGVVIRPYQLGVMIEVPAAVFQAEQLARQVDFLSVGTNDLTQYLLAVDRNNPQVAHLFDSLHPSVLQALQHVVKSAHSSGKSVSICGEMAGDPAAAILLLAMGADSLSMNASSLPRVKWVIRNMTQQQAGQLLEEALQCDSATTIRERLNKVLNDVGLGGLLRAGK